MKQLFLKSNLLHIRTNEGEFEVSNPDEIGYFNSTGMFYIWNSGNGDRVGIDNEVEWPGGVELIHQYKDRGQWHDATKKVQWRMYNNNHDIRDVARLLPKEKKENKICIASHGPASTQAESAYKEFEGKGKLIGHIIDDFKNGKEIFVPAVESSEPQEDRFNQALIEVPQDIKDQVEFEHNAINEAWELWGNIAKKDNVNPQAFVFGYVEAKKKYAVSTPSESQEEMWNEVNEHINAQIGDYISLEAVKLSFILTRKPE